MLFREQVGVYCENCKKHTDMLCGQNVEFWYIKVAGA
jgi:ribosomal protein L44E